MARLAGVSRQTREFEDAAQTQCSFYLEPVDGAPLPPFKPGQFLTFALQVPMRCRRGGRPVPITRCYSLSDRPDPARYRVTIKRVPPPAGRPDAAARAVIEPLSRPRATRAMSSR